MLLHLEREYDMSQMSANKLATITGYSEDEHEKFNEFTADIYVDPAADQVTLTPSEVLPNHNNYWYNSEFNQVQKSNYAMNIKFALGFIDISDKYGEPDSAALDWYDESSEWCGPLCTKEEQLQTPNIEKVSLAGAKTLNNKDILQYFKSRVTDGTHDAKMYTSFVIPKSATLGANEISPVLPSGKTVSDFSSGFLLNDTAKYSVIPNSGKLARPAEYYQQVLSNGEYVNQYPFLFNQAGTDLFQMATSSDIDEHYDLSKVYIDIDIDTSVFNYYISQSLGDADVLPVVDIGHGYISLLTTDIMKCGYHYISDISDKRLTFIPIIYWVPGVTDLTPSED